MPASDVPGYSQGFRFNAANYASNQFTDLSGYGSPLTTVTGTPVFETVEGYEGLRIDNTWHGQFWHPNSWQGTVVSVARCFSPGSGVHTQQFITFSGIGEGGSLGKMQLVVAGGNWRYQMISAGGTNTGTLSTADGDIAVGALCHDQMNRTAYRTKDAVSVDTVGPSTDAQDGNDNNMGTNSAGAYIGALSADLSNTTEITVADITLYELHFFEGNPIVNSATEMQAFLAELTAAYA